MKKLLSIFCLSLLVPLAANAIPTTTTTWYLDDPDGSVFGTVAYDGVGAILGVTAFISGNQESWTGPVPCLIPSICAQTELKYGDSFGVAAQIELIFSTPLGTAAANQQEVVPLTWLNIFTGLGNFLNDDISMTLTEIETPDENPFPPPSAVPAPATLALFGLGLAGLGWSRRKKA